MAEEGEPMACARHTTAFVFSPPSFLLLFLRRKLTTWSLHTLEDVLAAADRSPWRCEASRQRHPNCTRMTRLLRVACLVSHPLCLSVWPQLRTVGRHFSAIRAARDPSRCYRHVFTCAPERDDQTPLLSQAKESILNIHRPMQSTS